MINYDLAFAIVFYGLLILFFFKNRKDFEVQAKIMAIYRTQLGIKWMDKLSRVFPRILKFIGYISILFGFSGMAFIFYWLVKGTVKLILEPAAPPALAPVLPGIRVPGLPTLSFWHWVIAIFLVAVVHEFSHGIFARLYNIKVKSSGFALFGPILGAFVEPDEKILVKRSKGAQLSILSAGPFSNLVFGVVCLLILNFALAPVLEKFYEADGVRIKEIIKESAAEAAGLKAPFVLTAINDALTTNGSAFLNATARLKPGQEIKLITDKGEYNLVVRENEENKSKGFIGVRDFEINTKIKEEAEAKYGSALPKFILWINMLIFWLFIVNVGIGLFNLLPLGPVDGGRMFLVLSLALFRDNARKAQRFWGWVSFFCLSLIVINLMPYLIKLLLFIAKPFLFLIGLLI